MSSYLPSVGDTGVFTLSAPFESKLSPGEQYTVRAIRSISEYTANNEDILTSIYIKNNIADRWEEDVYANISIISIQSDKGHWLYVPESYIKSYPITNGIPYRALNIVIPLQPTPVSTDLTDFYASLSKVTKTYLGFDTKPQSVEVTKVVQVPSEKHLATKLQRDLVKSNSGSSELEISRLSNALHTANMKIKALEDYIATKL